MKEKDLEERENYNTEEGIIQKCIYEGIDPRSRDQWNRGGRIQAGGLMM